MLQDREKDGTYSPLLYHGLVLTPKNQRETFISLSVLALPNTVSLHFLINIIILVEFFSYSTCTQALIRGLLGCCFGERRRKHSFSLKRGTREECNSSLKEGVEGISKVCCPKLWRERRLACCRMFFFSSFFVCFFFLSLASLFWCVCVFLNFILFVCFLWHQHRDQSKWTEA